MHCECLRANTPERRPSQTFGPDTAAGSTRSVVLNSHVAASICGRDNDLQAAEDRLGLC